MSSKNQEIRSLNQWEHQLHLLSLKELESLRSNPQVFPCKPIELEYSVKLLMAKLPTLRREIALVLVSAQSDPSGSEGTYTLSDELARVFVHNNATDALTSDLATMCNEAGLLILRRALSKYKASDKYKAVELSANELVAQLDHLKGKAHQEKAQEKAEEFTEDFEVDERDRLRSYLRDTYGLNSAEDW